MKARRTVRFTPRARALKPYTPKQRELLGATGFDRVGPTGVPVVKAVVFERHSHFLCSWCGKVHIHGPFPGARTSHCERAPRSCYILELR